MASILPLLFGFLTAAAVVPLGIRLAVYVGFTDDPDGIRKHQTESIALGGGIMIFLCAVVSIALAYPFWSFGDDPRSLTRLLGLMASCGIILAVGLIDDARSVRGTHKLFVQTVAAYLLCKTGFGFERLDLLGLPVELGALKVFISVFWLVCCINAFNLIDGADGVAGVLGVTTSFTLAVIAVIKGNPDAALVPLAVGGALIGFLLYNLPPAKIYLGDSGSTLIGLVLGAAAMQASIKTQATFAIGAPLALFAIPIADTSFAFFRRKLTGRSIYETDRGHIHHLLLQRGLSPWGLVLLLTATMIGISAVSIASVAYSFDVALPLVVLLTVALFARLGYFGLAEFRLIAMRLFPTQRAFGVEHTTQPSMAVHLQGRRNWNPAWEAFVDLAERNDLEAIRMSLNMPWAHEAFHGRWGDSSSFKQRRNIILSLPLKGPTRNVGWIECSAGAGRDIPDLLAELDEVAQRLQVQLSLIEDLDPNLDKVGNGWSARPSDKTSVSSSWTTLHEAKETQPHVLFVNRSYWPDIEATGQLLTELCEDLSGSFNVSVLCGQPNRNLTGLGFQTRGRQEKHNVGIQRVWHTTYDKRAGRKSRALNMISFFANATFSALNMPRPQVVVVETDPPLLCILGYLLKKIRGCKYVLYLQDIYPDVAIQLGQLPRWFPVRMCRALFFHMYRNADLVVVLSEDMRQLMLDSGLAADRVVIVPNWIDTRQVYPNKQDNPFRREQGWDEKFVVMYSGNIGLSQPLEVVLDAAKILESLEHVQFAIVGDGARKKWLEDEVQRRGAKNIQLIGYQPKQVLAASLSAADLHLVMLDSRLKRCLMPSKIYGVLASGTPPIVMADADCELARMVSEEEVGVVSDVDDAEQLANCVRDLESDRPLLEQVGQRARALAEQRFRRDICTGQFAAALRGVTHPGGESQGLETLASNDTTARETDDSDDDADRQADSVGHLAATEKSAAQS